MVPSPAKIAKSGKSRLPSATVSAVCHEGLAYPPVQLEKSPVPVVVTKSDVVQALTPPLPPSGSTRKLRLLRLGSNASSLQSVSISAPPKSRMPSMIELVHVSL